MSEEILSDFSAKWCQDLLNSSDVINTTTLTRRPPPPADQVVTNSLFSKTFRSDTTVRAWQTLQAKHITSPNVSPEFFLLLSLGEDLNGYKGILHGGMLGMIADQATSMCAILTGGPKFVTAETQLHYNKSVPLPSVILCRTVATSRKDRKLWTKSVFENGKGTIYGQADVLFLMRSEQKL